MSCFHFIITTSDGNIFDDYIEGLLLRSCEGDSFVSSSHIPFATSVQAGMCRIWLKDGSKKTGKITEGLLSLSKETVVLSVGDCILLER